MSVRTQCLTALIIISSFVGSMFMPHFRHPLQIDLDSGSLTITYDSDGVAQIQVHNEERKLAAYGLGYAHALDRLWQMHGFRMASYGRLSEMSGPSTIDLDKTLRLLNTRETCASMMKFLEPKTLEYLTMYAQGVNEFVEQHTLPLQFYLAWTGFEPWKPEDSCSILKLISFQLSHNWNKEILRDYLTAITSSTDIAYKLFPFLPEHLDEFATYTINDDELRDTGMFKETLKEKSDIFKRKPNPKHYETEVPVEIPEDLSDDSNTRGSNSWVVSGKHTKSGKALFANDPHLPNRIPSFWHASHITRPGGGYTFGHCVPGIPFHGTFTTEKIALGVTTIIIDNTDVYEEKIEGESYWFKSKKLPLEKRSETIIVKGQDPVVFDVKLTQHGPVLQPHNTAFKHICSKVPHIIPKDVFTLKWAGLDMENDNGFDQMYKASQADTVFEVIEIITGKKLKETNTKQEDLKPATGFTQNFIVADVHGNIGLAVGGSLVKRPNRVTGYMISEGWTGEHEWEGYISPSERPYIVNPKKGYIVAANGPITSINTTSPGVAFTGSNPRANRITQMLDDLVKKKSGKIEYKDMHTILKDEKDLTVSNIKDDMYHTVVDYMKQGTKEEEEIKTVLEKIHLWDSNFSQDLEEPTYISAWIYYVFKNMVIEGIPEDLRLELLPGTVFKMKVFKEIRDDKAAHKLYCSQYNNRTTKSCGEFMYLALKDAVEYLHNAKKSESIKWGDYHQIVYSYIPFSKNFILHLLGFNERKIKCGGSSDTVRALPFRYSGFPEKKFYSEYGANSKMIVDMGDQIHYSIDTGQSENVFSPYFFNFNQRHLENDLINYPHV